MTTKPFNLAGIFAAAALWLCVSAGLSPAADEPAPAKAADSAADQQYSLAARDYHEQHWQAAADGFERFAQQHTSDLRVVKAKFFRGEALSQLNQYTAARDEFAAVLAADAQGRYARQSLFRLGECALLAGEAQAALQQFAEFEKQFPGDALLGHVHAYRADLALASSDFATAKRHYEAALQGQVAGTLAADCRLGLARATQLQGDSAAAAEMYRTLADEAQDERSTKLADRGDKALYYLADLQLTAGDCSSAERTLAELAEKLPQSELRQPAALLRAAALRRLDRYADADKLLQGIEAESPHFVEAQFGLGLSQKSQQHYEQAAKTFLAAVPTKPHRLSATLHFEAGDAYLLSNQLPEATAQFECVLKEWPDGELADDALLGKLQVALAGRDHALAIKLTDEFLQRFAASELQADVRLTRATLLARHGERGQAEEALASLSGENKETTGPAALATLVVLQIQKHDLAAATRTLTQLRTASPRHPRVASLRYQLAEAAYAMENYELAAQQFQLASDDPQVRKLGPRVASGLGWSQFQLGQFAAAAATFATFGEKYADDKLASEAMLMRGQSLEKLGQLDGALTVYKSVVDTFPESVETPTALWRGARLHQQMQQPRDASTLYAKLAVDHPQAPHADAALYHWAWLEYDTGHVIDAVKLWNRLRASYPRSRYFADATFRLAELALSKREFADAEVLVSELIAAQPAHDLAAHARFLQARIAIAKGEWDKVSQPLEQLLAENADSALKLTAQFWLAEAAYRQGKFELAWQLHTAALRDGRVHAPLWLPTSALRRAQALAQLTRWPEALEAAMQAAHDYSDFAERYEIDYLIGRCHANLAEFSEARAAYQRVLDSSVGGKTETAAMAQWMIGETYFHQEDYPTALRAYLRVDEDFAYPQWQASALLQAGKCRELMYDWKQAVTTYSRLLKNHPSSPLAEEARRRLEIAQQRARNQRRS